MPEPVPLFHAERWVTQWQTLGGAISIRAGSFCRAGKRDVDGPGVATLRLAEPWNSPRRQQIQHLHAMLDLPGARDRVIEYMSRQGASSGRN
jgi:hypothetical protein